VLGSAARADLIHLQFSLLFGVSALLDFFWLVGGNVPGTLAWFLIVLNFLLKVGLGSARLLELFS